MNYLFAFYRKWQYHIRRKALLTSLNFGNQSNQFFLISYPKSGNTWIRMLLANLLAGGDEITLLNVGNYVPDTHVEAQAAFLRNSRFEFYQLPKQIVKAHDSYSKFFCDKQVIFIVRDGRDALNSYYHYLNARRETPVSLLSLIRGHADPMGTWSSHVMGWKQGVCRRKFIIRYEDMLADAKAEIRKLLDFMEWAPGEDQVQSAIENTSFQNLKQLEQKYGGINPVKAKGENTAFFRRGKHGDWTETFSQADLAVFWKIHGRAMREFGYE